MVKEIEELTTIPRGVGITGTFSSVFSGPAEVLDTDWIKIPTARG